MAYRRRTHVRFGRTPRVAVRVIQKIRTGRPGPCMGCGQRINLGDDYVQLRLAKWAAGPCSTCNQTPKRMRRYHLACQPLDVEKAMGYGVVHAAPQPAAAPPPPPTPTPSWMPPPRVNAPAVAPPPKPKTSTELKVEGIVMLEAALAAGIRERNITKTPELAKQFTTLANIKARIIGGSTAGEQESATNVALKKIIDIVFTR